MKRIYVAGTADTKGEELAYLAARIEAAGGTPVIVDVGINEPTIRPDVTASEVAKHGPEGTQEALVSGDRGRAVAAMAAAFARFASVQKDMTGIIGIGGGGGTSIVTSGMRELPLGLPKLMVSTLASGDVSPYVGVSDIIMMPSITDMAGLNRISRVILANAAQAIVGMANNPPIGTDSKPALGLTMFGVTTTCVTEIVDRLKRDYDCLVFHATGTGGRAMEKLADSGLLSGILDMTTTEVCDLLFGGVLPATEDRFGAIARTRLPYVGSVGALDMVNFWAPETVPSNLAGPAVLQAQFQCDADAHDSGGMSRHRRMDWQEAQRLRGTGAFSHPRKGRIGTRHRRRRVLGSASGCGAVLGARGDGAPNRSPPRRAAAAAHQRSKIRPSRCRRFQRNRQLARD